MSQGMTHEEARDTLEGLSLDALSAAERDAALAHVAACSTCRDHLTALRGTAAQLTYAVPPLPMSPAQRERLRGRLLERAKADRNPTVDFSLRTPLATTEDVIPIGIAAERRHPGRASNWAAMAASLIAVVSVGMLVRTMEERDMLRESLRVVTTSRVADAAALEASRAAITDRDRLIASLTGPDVAVMTLAASSGGEPTARMFWDRAAHTWTFVAHHLPAPRPGRAYQLWLVTAGGKISAGTFTPGSDGEAVVRARYALDRNALDAVAVTEEPEHGSAQPTTAPFIAGTAATR